MSSIRQPRTEYSVLTPLQRFDWDNFIFAMIVTAPAIILHELAHKFLALAFGLQALFHASYWGLGIGVFLRIINSPFIFFVPGYVSIQGGTALQSAMTAVIGPLMNLALFAGAHFILTRKKTLTQKQAMILYLTKQINLFLFIFNMLPIPPFDGSKFFYSLFQAF